MTLQEIREKANILLEKSDNAETVEEKRLLDEELAETITDYTAASKIATYKAIAASPNPLHKAIIDFHFPSIRVKETKDNDTGMIIRSIVDCKRPIDLGDLNKKLKGIGADKEWVNMVDALKFHMTVRAASRMGSKVKCDAIMIKRIYESIDLGENPCSEENILKSLNMIVKAMLGDEYEAIEKDVNYLVDTYTRDNKKSTSSVSAADRNTFRNSLIKKICRRILTNGECYEVEDKDVDKVLEKLGEE